MWQLTKIELFKIFSKPRSYIGFSAVAIIAVVIQIALYADGKSYWDFLIQSLDESFQIENLTFNGNMVCFILLQALIVQMPLLVALVSGDAISGEAAAGTIRSLLTKPVSRSKILWAKLLSNEIYTFLLVLWLGILAWLVSLAIFGSGDLVVLKSDSLTIIRSTDSAWRFIAAFGIAFLSLSVVVTLALLLSVFSENSIAPIIITMSIIILFTIIGTFDLPFFNQLKPFLFTTHMIIWRNLFDSPLPTEQIFESIGVLVLHIVLFLAITFYHFKRKDITQ